MPRNGDTNTVGHRSLPRSTSSHLHRRFQLHRRSPPWVWRVVGMLFVLNLTLVILASFAWTRLRRLSLPFSTPLPLLATALPILNFLGLSHGLVLSRGQRQKLQTFRTYLYVLVFIVFDTIATVVSFTHLNGNGNVATCELSEQWQTFWVHKDAGTVKRIQDQLGCCGFRSVKDRAWPFNDPSQCHQSTRRETSCSGPWRREEKRVAGIFVAVGIVLGVVKFIGLIVINKDQLFAGAAKHEATNGAGENGTRHDQRMLIEEIPSETEDEGDAHGEQRREDGGAVRGHLEGADERTGLLDENGEPRTVHDGGNVWRE